MFLLLVLSKWVCVCSTSDALKPFLPGPLETWLSSITGTIPHLLPTLYFIPMLMSGRFTAREAAEMQDPPVPLG